jgi:flagellar biosynthesis/type III secretory pathway chaperone
MHTIAESHPMQISLESEVASLLNDILAGQNELLEILGRKQKLLGAADHDGMAAMAGEEQRLMDALQDCLRRREELLARAAAEGLPSKSIHALTGALPPAQRPPLTRQISTAESRARLLQHQSLINWVVIQRTLIHLSQLLEIIATGGRLQPTYGDTGAACAHGALLNQEA